MQSKKGKVFPEALGKGSHGWVPLLSFQRNPDWTL
jgi:hypothetical protein